MSKNAGFSHQDRSRMGAILLTTWLDCSNIVYSYYECMDHGSDFVNEKGANYET
jgi:hypothetical protein